MAKALCGLCLIYSYGRLLKAIQRTKLVTAGMTQDEQWNFMDDSRTFISQICTQATRSTRGKEWPSVSIFL